MTAMTTGLAAGKPVAEPTRLTRENVPDYLISECLHQPNLAAGKTPDDDPLTGKEDEWLAAISKSRGLPNEESLDADLSIVRMPVRIQGTQHAMLLFLKFGNFNSELVCVVALDGRQWHALNCQWGPEKDAHTSTTVLPTTKDVFKFQIQPGKFQYLVILYHRGYCSPCQEHSEATVYRIIPRNGSISYLANEWVDELKGWDKHRWPYFSSVTSSLHPDKSCYVTHSRLTIFREDHFESLDPAAVGLPPNSESDCWGGE